jgi:hypothetical protein
MSLPVETSDALTMTSLVNHVNYQNNLMTIIPNPSKREAYPSNCKQQCFRISLGQRSDDPEPGPKFRLRCRAKRNAHRRHPALIRGPEGGAWRNRHATQPCLGDEALFRMLAGQRQPDMQALRMGG